jgi:CcmD family protein
MIDLAAAQVSNAWWYVTAAYTIIFGGIVLYVSWLGVRLRRARRELNQIS